MDILFTEVPPVQVAERQPSTYVVKSLSSTTTGSFLIVSCCPASSRHISIEYCHSVKSIKAVTMVHLEYKMLIALTKFSIIRWDGECNEAFWCILDFPVHECYPSVMYLDMHLENGERVYFTALMPLNMSTRSTKNEALGFL